MARKFCLIIGGLFCALLLAERIAPFVLPQGAYFFHPLEYMTGTYRYNIPRASQTMTLEGYGDLANIAGLPELRVPHHYVWTNDAYGLRNDPLTQHEDPEILLVGDSFIQSGADSDADAFATQLQKRVKPRVTAYASANMSQFLEDPRFREKSPPLVVWGRIERNLLANDPEIGKILADTHCFASPSWRLEALKTAVKRVIGPFKEYASLSIVRRVSRMLVRQGVFVLTGELDPGVRLSSEYPGMLLFTKSLQLLDRPAADRGYPAVADAVRHVQDCLSERGSKFVFLPIPDKEHVYGPVSQAEKLSPDPFAVLAQELRARYVPFVNLWPAFSAAAKNGKLLYWPDDTHWNKDGILLAVTTLMPMLTITR